MTLSFRAGMSACAFVVDGLYRYLKEHKGEEPVELVLRPEHKRVLSDELRVGGLGVRYDTCSFNNIPVLEDPCCRVPWLVTPTVSAGTVTLSSCTVANAYIVAHGACLAAVLPKQSVSRGRCFSVIVASVSVTS